MLSFYRVITENGSIIMDAPLRTIVAVFCLHTDAMRRIERETHNNAPCTLYFNKQMLGVSAVIVFPVAVSKQQPDLRPVGTITWVARVTPSVPLNKPTSYTTVVVEANDEVEARSRAEEFGQVLSIMRDRRVNERSE